MRIQNPLLLKNIPIFQHLDDNDLPGIAEEIEVVRFARGRLIYKQGDKGGTMFIVLSGCIELFLHDSSDERISLEIIQKGGLFGELSLLDNHPRSAGAKALETTELLVINRDGLQKILIAHPNIAFDILSIIGTRLRGSNHLVRQRTTRNVNMEMSETMVSFGHRLSDLLTRIMGSIPFVYFCAAVIVVWIVVNAGLISGIEPFDPFPFGLLAMSVSTVGIFFSLFVLISQNREAAYEKLRNDIEYEINMKAEGEIRELSKQIETLEQIMIYHFSMIEPIVAGEERAEEARRTTLKFQSIAKREP